MKSGNSISCLRTMVSSRFSQWYLQRPVAIPDEPKDGGQSPKMGGDDVTLACCSLWPVAAWWIGGAWCDNIPKHWGGVGDLSISFYIMFLKWFKLIPVSVYVVLYCNSSSHTCATNRFPVLWTSLNWPNAIMNQVEMCCPETTSVGHSSVEAITLSTAIEKLELFSNVGRKTRGNHRKQCTTTNPWWSSFSIPKLVI